MKLLVRSFIILTFVIWIAFDVWLTQHGGPTESQVLTEWAKMSTFLPFLVGFLGGHWFFTVKRPWKQGWMWALPIMIALVLFDVAWGIWGIGYPWFRWPGFYLGLGVPAGALLWGQQDGDSPV